MPHLDAYLPTTYTTTKVLFLISDPSCQLVTHQTWRRGFVKLHRPICILGIFFPFLVWTPLVKFQPGLGDDGGSLNPLQKIYVFYKCPIVKYTGICLSFLAFLGTDHVLSSLLSVKWMENFLGFIPYRIPSLNSCFQIIINIKVI